jgi:hypothetical protein
MLDEVLGFVLLTSSISWRMRCAILMAAHTTARHIFPERREMMQKRADYLDALKGSADVMPLFKRE